MTVISIEKHKEKKNREMDIREDERADMEDGPSGEEEIKRKLLKRPEADESLDGVAGGPSPSNAKVEERGDREEEEELSWEVRTFDLACLDDFQVFIPDLESSLGPDEKEQFRRDFAALTIKSRTVEKKKETKKLKYRVQDQDDESPELKKQKRIQGK